MLYDAVSTAEEGRSGHRPPAPINRAPGGQNHDGEDGDHRRQASVVSSRRGRPERVGFGFGVRMSDLEEWPAGEEGGFVWPLDPEEGGRAAVVRRNARRRRWDFEIRSVLQELRPAKKSKKVPGAGEPFTPLTDEEEAEVQRALSGERSSVLVNHKDSGIQITGKTLSCLGPRAWLNDEVIDLYLKLLKEREKRDPQKFLKCHFFIAFFYTKLIRGRSGYDYTAVRNWTTQKKLGYSLIDCDKIFVPIHQKNHWCLAIINKKDEKFQYLDSLGGKDLKVLNALARYIVDEVKDKCGKVIDVSSWKQEYVSDLPAQKNGYDCGMFMIKYADFYSRGLELCFKQGHMPHFRRRTALEILRLRAD